MSKVMYNFYSPDGLRVNRQISNSSRLVLNAASEYGVDWQIIEGTQIVNLTYKGESKSYYFQVPSTTTALAIFTSNNKKVTNNLLNLKGLHVPNSFEVKAQDSPEFFKQVFDSLQKPLAIKPISGSTGDNITLNVKNYDHYQKALRYAFEYAKNQSVVLVEEMFVGKEYRILATQEKVIGILNRIPANVIGDGLLTVNQLIDKKNSEIIRQENGFNSHLQINLDDNTLENLNEVNLNLDSIPENLQQVFLRKVSNISKGGDAIDCTDIAHKSVFKIAQIAMSALPGLSFAGIDLITKDITKPQDKDTYAIIEINESPGFDIHDYPYEGIKRFAAEEFLFLMYPQLKESKKLGG